MLDGRFSDGVAVAQRALDAALDTGMRSVEGHARNTLGFCLAMTGEVERGAEELREAIRIARERDHLPDLDDGYNNYSDMLHIVGRTTEALAAVADGLEAIDGRRPVSMMWLDVPAGGVRVRHRRVAAVGGAACRPRNAGPGCRRA